MGQKNWSAVFMISEILFPLLPEWILLIGMGIIFLWKNFERKLKSCFSCLYHGIDLSSKLPVKPFVAQVLTLASVIISLIASQRGITFQRSFHFLLHDDFVRVVKMILLTSSAIFLILSGRKLSNRFLILFLLFLFSSLFIIASYDLSLLIVVFEIESLSLMLMIDEHISADDPWAEQIYLIFCLGGGIFILGCAFLFFRFGTLQFDALLRNPQAIRFLSFVFFGILLKTLLIPCHGLFTKTCEKMPWSVGFVFNVLVPFTHCMLLIRLGGQSVPVFWKIMGCLSSLIGFCSLIGQKNLKSILSCLTLGNIGFFWIGYAVSGINIVTSIFLFFIIHMMSWLLLYTLFDKITDLASVKRQAISFAVGITILCLAGFPLLPIFVPILIVLKNTALDSSVGILVFMIGLRLIAIYAGITLIAQLFTSIKSSSASAKLSRKIWHGVFLIILLSIHLKADACLRALNTVEISMRYYDEDLYF